MICSQAFSPVILDHQKVAFLLRSFARATPEKTARDNHLILILLSSDRRFAKHSMRRMRRHGVQCYSSVSTVKPRAISNDYSLKNAYLQKSGVEQVQQEIQMAAFQANLGEPRQNFG